MKKSSLVIIGLAAVVIAVVVFGSPKDNIQDSDYAYHVNLSEAKYGEIGIYEESFEIGDEICQRFCEYKFKFVPNGDSPQTLSISMYGDSISFFEDFQLVGTSVETDISQYYTWDYDGQKSFQVSGLEKVKITIDPHENTKGTVSVYINQE